MQVAKGLALVLAAFLMCLADPVRSNEAPPGDGARTALGITIAYLGKTYAEAEPLSLVDKIYTDKGIQGARVGLVEDNMTGRLIGQHYALVEAIVPEGEDIKPKALELFKSGVSLIVADLEPADLLAVADLPEANDAIIMSIRSSDDRIRNEDCRKNIFHIPPDWAMRADALAQFLIWKQWRKWALISGEMPKDKDYAAAVRRAAARFGGKIVGEKSYAYVAGSRRTDTGHQQIQKQMPLLTQGLGDADVIIVADVEESFGDYLLFNSYEPRPVAGTHGLTAVSWHRSYEESAATQMQNRFERKTGRVMTERDYSAWLAVRTFGEAVTRTNSADPGVLRSYLLSDKFEVAGFKSQGMNFRRWDRQLRQPVLLAGPRALVSISPQEGFLHPKYLTDTLGYDEPESKCRQRN
ncbi:ABC transporter substrate-binding protein [Hyphomicrobium sp.]|uniref:ABC transporter substrate-binding protein n=1 Tax=Hyphomicrobium sp. TaxID=82 RepID=UPI001DD21FC3|nr:ABC transporter substrate-binding protein [Hyphomicrobium sp.]MBY0559602.1 ABC transporter substrate-binding protein [Hyphomicrobium sp.]